MFLCYVILTLSPTLSLGGLGLASTSSGKIEQSTWILSHQQDNEKYYYSHN